MSEESFWVAIPHEAIVAISEEYPRVGQFLATTAIVPNADHPQLIGADNPRKLDVRECYTKALANRRCVHCEQPLADHEEGAHYACWAAESAHAEMGSR